METTQLQTMYAGLHDINDPIQLLDCLSEIAQLELTSRLSSKLAEIDREYWSQIESDYAGVDRWDQPELLAKISTTFTHLVDLIFKEMNQLKEQTYTLVDSSLREQYLRRLRVIVKSLLPSCLWPMAYCYTRHLLQEFEDIQHAMDHIPLPSIDDTHKLISVLDNVVKHILSSDHRAFSSSKFNIIKGLREMRELRRIFAEIDEQWLQQMVIKVSMQAMEYLVYATAHGSFEVSAHSQCQYWLDHVLLPLIHCVFYYDDNATPVVIWYRTLSDHLARTLASLRISELFNIIVEHPACKGALEDLKICIKTSHQRDQLVATLATSIDKRLLHPGADTSDILMHYISMIRCLRFIDPPGTLLERVAEPVRNYLRGRDDTIRCIAEDLMNESRSDLIEELTAGDSGQGYTSDSEDEDGDDPNWEPIPIDAGPRLDTLHRRNADAISMLINRDVFVKAFQAMFAERLLAIDDYDTEKEIRNLEMLKLRFGETNLQSCEVMIKDFADSKRFEQYLHQDYASDIDVRTDVIRPIILSRLSWPEFKSEEFALPDMIDSLYTTSSHIFSEYKQQRKLVLIPQVELEFDERTVEFHVSPPHATVIMAFDQQDKWEINELANKLKMPLPLLKRRLYFWCGHGILKEVDQGHFVVQSSAGEQTDTQGVVMAEEAHDDTSINQEEESTGEMLLYWNVIKNMLSSMGPQPLERIHTTLSMFLQGPVKFTKSHAELRDMLDAMVTEEKLIWADGQYRLKR
ncbi:hypothetical protein BDF22DRAFT_675531 [Syncephalis plumigaleata]|nr:hypothetical protein BDF22DRAFT_675531 [Syncephalis plumigaleata]